MAVQDAGAEARAWLLARAHGVLSTCSAEPEQRGWPFASVVPFALAADGAPFVLISALAEHTRNLQADPRAALFVDEGIAQGSDPQAGWRLTVQVRARPLEPEGLALDAARALERAELEARYAERVPRASEYRKLDFHYWRLEPVRARWIAGFGRMGWLAGSELLRDPHGAGLAEAAPGILAHMNADHEAALIDICAARSGERPGGAQLTAVDRSGFLVRTRDPERLHHVSFGREIRAEDAREVFVALTRAARAARAGA
jgi:putative heme iron utilization protein